MNGTTEKKLEKLNIYCKIDQSTMRRAVFAEHWKSIQFAYTKIILYEKWTFGYLANTKKRNKIKLKQHLLCTSETVYAQRKHSRASFKVFFMREIKWKLFWLPILIRLFGTVCWVVVFDAFFLFNSNNDVIKFPFSMHCREEFHLKEMNTESTPSTRTYFALQQTHADKEKNRRIHRQQASAGKNL